MTNHVVEFKRNLDVLLSDDRHKKKEHYKRNVVSCGIIMYKLINHEYYYLCVHPGGPYFKYKDKYAWSIPKGVVETNERFKETACREFEEETGIKITNELKSSGELEMVGGPYYITMLTSRVASAANIEYHARIIQQKHIQRDLIAISSEIIRDAYEDTTDVFSLVTAVVLVAGEFGIICHGNHPGNCG
jgi:hypothetical protein